MVKIVFENIGSIKLKKLTNIECNNTSLCVKISDLFARFF